MKKHSEIAVTLYDTLSRSKRVFEPQKNNDVCLYVCGITPYAPSHLGHARSYINFDVLFRTLKLFGYNVTYVRNITDIDDKLLAGAEKELGDQMRYGELATKFTNQYHDDMKALGCLPPDEEPRATDHIDQIISFIKGLVEGGHAYAVEGDVYFDVTSFETYGSLSRRSLDDMKAGARVEVNEKKRNPADFALWKGNDKGLFWESPWGHGRPGWHIECSAMAHDYCGATLDIHGGGADLIFPHHENEVAQSEALNRKPFARYWLHNALLNFDAEKMSKSLGNVVSVGEVKKTIDPMVLRMYMLHAHYRTPIDFDETNVKAVETAYSKLATVFTDSSSLRSYSVDNYLADDCTRYMVEALADDLNTAKVLGLVFEKLDECKNDRGCRALVGSFLRDVLGLEIRPLPGTTVDVTPEIADLIAKREKARESRDWKLADELRDRLAELGYRSHDKKTG